MNGVAAGGRGERGSVLVERLQAGDPEALRLLAAQIRRDRLARTADSPGLVLFSQVFRGQLLGWLRKLFEGDEEAALEAWNDTLLRVWERIETFDEQRSSFRRWAYNQAKWAALDLRRQLSRHARETGFDDVSESAEQAEWPSWDEGEVLSRNEERAFWQAWKRLRPQEQRLLVLRYVLGLGNVEIARRGLLDKAMPEEHVRVYVNRFASRLRRLYEQELANIERG